ncbi:MAG: gephyrin-like molybdotransferase Glp [Candidatus Hydrothermarchaeaceae archaeon]
MTDVRTRGFFKKMPVDEALGILMDRVKPLPVENIDIADAPNRVLAREVTAGLDIPPFNRSAMDGYAVKGENTFGAGQTNPIYFRVIGEVVQGVSPQMEAGEFEAVKIMTGGELPEGTDAIVMLEYTRKREKEIEVVKAVAPGKNVSLKGEDVKKGDVVLKKGRVLRLHDVGVLAALGLDKIEVAKRPTVGIISTGDELAMPGKKIKTGQVYDSNSYALSALVVSSKGIPNMLGVIKDDHAELKDAIRRSLEHDAVILSGATSVGEKDVVPEIVEELGEVLVHGVSMRPGGPTGLGIIDEKPVFMLPGHPAASIFGFEVFVRPALQKMQGAIPYNPYPQTEGVLKKKIASELGRRDFVWVTVNEKGGVTPVRTSSTGIVSSLVRADGFVVVPENTEGVEKGKKVKVKLWK